MESKINDKLVIESERFVSGLLADKLPELIIYHNFDRVLALKKNAETIGREEGLNPEEMNMLRICALFQDVGYISSYEDVKTESIAIATSFLTGYGADPVIIDRVAETITATLQPQDPKDRIATVLCDANMMFITMEDGMEQFDLMYDERALLKMDTGKRVTFEKMFIKSLKAHTFFTDFGKQTLQSRKEDAIRRLSERMKRRKKLEKQIDKFIDRRSGYSRSIDTLFRLTARNQINLNSIADNKSNILISVNAIIISIIITVLVGNIRNMSDDILPVLVLLLICLVTIVIAILSTRPIILSKKFGEKEIEKKEVDLIFFGTFVKMEYDEYLKAVLDMARDDEHLYSTLIKNQYSLGKILSKKFRLIKIAYNIFMVGIIITVVVFLVNLIVTNNPPA